MKEVKINNSILRILKEDITKQTTDAIVNAANKRLAPGGGVAGAIHRVAGPQLWEECKTLNGCSTGEAKITRGYRLNASYVIHTVGPIYSGSIKNEKQLTSCYKKSLQLAFNHKLNSISFPAISTGAFGYPIYEAAKIAVQTVYNWLNENNKNMIVQFVLFDENTLQIFNEALDKIS